MRCVFRIGAAFFGLVCSSGPARAISWTEWGPAPLQPGPYSGRVSAIAISPANNNIWFVGGADGGVWRSSDAGASYEPLTDDLPTTAVGAIAIDPQNPQTIYVGTGEANFAQHSRYGLGIYKSTDLGQTWQHLAQSALAGRCIARLIVNPQNSSQLFAAVTRAGGFPELAAARGHPLATGPVGVFRSDDAGETWTHLVNGLPDRSATDLTLNPLNPLNLVAGIGHIFGDPANGLYRSLDGGASWSKLAGGLPTTGIGRLSVSMAPSLPARVYTMITRSADAAGGGASSLGAWRSDDGGATWSPLASFTNLQATYGWYLSVVTVHPTDPDLVWFGGLNVRRTTDGGGTFSTATPPHVDLHAIVWNHNASRVVFGSDGGVHDRTSTGTTWFSRNQGLGLFQFYAGVSTHPAIESYLIGGNQDNGTNRRDTSGQWFNSLGGDGGWTQLDGASPNRVFAELQGSGQLYRSTDTGQNFGFVGADINAGDRNCFLPPYVIDPSNPQRMLYGTQRVYQSLNGGTSWTAISADLTGGSGAIRALALAQSNPLVVYAVTNDGRVLRSDNGGSVFNLLLSNHPGWPRVTREICVHPAEPLTVILAAGRFGVAQVRRSIDGGVNWISLDGDLPDVPVHVVAWDTRGPRPALYAGTDQGLFRSTDDGARWRRYGDGMPNTPIIDLVLEPGRGRLIAATQGRGAWVIPIGILGDLNCDGIISVSDIGPFVTALTDPSNYATQFPACLIENGDMNGDGLTTVGDIGEFVELLTS